METENWLSYFEVNKKNILEIPFESYELTELERKNISSSIQSFQLGESSEGKILRKQAQRYSDKVHCTSYLKAIEHLIREENRHSAYLGKFMSLHEIPKIKKGWSDSCFRFLRRLAGVELSVRVLVTAEVIAITYYDCLSDATGSRVLKEICKRMCEEEKMHVMFQMHHIHEMNFRKHALLSALSNIFHFVLLETTLLPVWLEHKSVLQSKFRFKTFKEKVRDDFREHTFLGQKSAARALTNDGFFSQDVLCT